MMNSFFQNDFQVMTKPAGPLCNLDCEYCYYLEKRNLYPSEKIFRMPDDILEIFIKQYIESQSGPVVEFSWQGGEPTLCGIDFFRKVVELQKKYGGGRSIGNSFQTNGLLLNDEWCGFFEEYKFFIGISIDGPEHIHNKYRKSIPGKPSFNRVMKSLKLLKKHNVEFNTLSVVSDYSSRYPKDVYKFLKDTGSGYMQFLPVIEREAVKSEEGLSLVPPGKYEDAEVTYWSVKPEQYGRFLTEIFDIWVKTDVGKVYVQMFDVTLAAWAGEPSGICVFNKMCGNNIALEHNGDVYSCDHFVYGKYKLGNILEQPLGEIVKSPRQIRFGFNKFETLPEKCLNCSYLSVCWGGCPKHRITETGENEKRLNYFCNGLLHYYDHVKPYMDFMVNEYRNGRAPANVMKIAIR